MCIRVQRPIGAAELIRRNRDLTKVLRGLQRQERDPAGRLPARARRTRRAGGAILAAVLAIGGLLALGGCADLLQVNGSPSTRYTLTPKSSFPADLPAVSWQLVVDKPIARGGLNTNRIAVHPTPTEVKYFAGARWNERAPRMLHTLVLESFENSGRIVRVGREAIGLRADYRLKLELREFQAEYFDGAKRATVRVHIHAKLVQGALDRIVAARSFRAAEPAEARGMAPVIAGFDRALGTVLKEVVAWTLTEPQGGTRRPTLAADHLPAQ